jgi:hypothetical protein
MGVPFPVMVPLPGVRNPIFSSAFTVRFFLILVRAPNQSQTCTLYLKLEKRFSARKQKLDQTYALYLKLESASALASKN